jgi:hypothetical protein
VNYRVIVLALLVAVLPELAAAEGPRARPCGPCYLLCGPQGCYVTCPKCEPSKVETNWRLLLALRARQLQLEGRGFCDRDAGFLQLLAQMQADQSALATILALRGAGTFPTPTPLPFPWDGGFGFGGGCVPELPFGAYQLPADLLQADPAGSAGGTGGWVLRPGAGYYQAPGGTWQIGIGGNAGQGNGGMMGTPPRSGGQPLPPSQSGGGTSRPAGWVTYSLSR